MHANLRGQEIATSGLDAEDLEGGQDALRKIGIGGNDAGWYA